MTLPLTRRKFLAEIGRGMLVATVGYEAANELGLAPALGEEATLSIGSLEPLVCLPSHTSNISNQMPTASA